MSKDSEQLPASRMSIDWSQLISHQDIIQQPVADNHRDGLRLGNGDLGVSVFVADSQLSLAASKNDLLDYRSVFEGGYSTPLPSAKPAGTIRIRSACFGGNVKGRLNLWHAQADINCPDGTRADCLVSYQQQLVLLQFYPKDEQHADIELVRHKDSAGYIDQSPVFGASDCDLWFTYKFPPDEVNYPQGFEYAMYARVLGADTLDTETITDFRIIQQWYGWDGLTKDAIESLAVAHVSASKPVTVIVAVITLRDASNPLEHARACVENAARTTVQPIKAAHRRFWSDYWRRSFVILEGNAFLTQQWYLSQYHLACSWREGSAMPGLLGNWTWEDFPPWGNDIHWDYNTQCALWGAYSSNHLEQTKPYYDQALDLLEISTQCAKDTYGIDDACIYPVLSWPIKYKRYPQSPRHPAMNGWVSHLFWWYYQYSQDERFLRDNAYPVLRACARFYESFLIQADDGRFDVPPTSCWDLPAESGNNIMDMAFSKAILRTAADASEILECDDDHRPVWRNMADRIRQYPTTTVDPDMFAPQDHRVSGAVPAYVGDIPRGQVFVNYEGFAVIEYNAPMPIMPVFPTGDIGLHSPSDIQDIAQRTCKITPYFLFDDLIMLSMAWVRLGVNILPVFEKHSRTLRLINGCMTYPMNIDYKSWGYFNGWPIVINECILQSYTGELRIAPVKLGHTVWFGGLRATGAFLLGGEIGPGGLVRYVTIQSEAGKLCRLVNPWAEHVRIRQWPTMDALSTKEQNGTIHFKTQANCIYILDRATDPWEHQVHRDLPGCTSSQ